MKRMTFDVLYNIYFNMPGVLRSHSKGFLLIVKLLNLFVICIIIAYNSILQVSIDNINI